MQRRQFLGSTAALGAGGLVGAPGGTRAQVDVQTGDGPETPSVPVGEAAGEWTVDPERSGTFSDTAVGVTTTGTTVAYVDEGLTEALRERTLGADVGDVRHLFATRIQYRPAVDRLPFGVGRGVVMDATESNARERFERRLEDAGLEGIERRETRSLNVRNGPTADLLYYDAVYPLEEFEFEAGNSTVTLGGDRLEAEAMLAVWYSTDPGSTLVAGAVNPAENYEETVDRRLSEGVEFTLDVDLGLTPNAYREESRDLLRSVN